MTTGRRTVGPGRMERIRTFYGIPARRGLTVTRGGVEYTITGTTAGPMYLRLRPAAGGRPITIHPLDAEYPKTQ